MPAVEQWRYRNKLEYSFGEEGDELTLGFHARGRWDLVVDADDCHLASERGNEARNAVREWARAEAIPAFDRRSPAASTTSATSSTNPPTCRGAAPAAISA